MLFLQVPDPSEVMKTAHETGSWVVVLLCFLVLAMVAGFVMLFKMMRDTYKDQVAQLQKDSDERNTEARARETRMAERIDTLEQAQFDKMTTMLGQLMELTTKTEATLSEFCGTQREINGDLKDLVAKLEVSPCLVHRMSNIKVVDRDTGQEVPLDERHEMETG